MVRYPLLSQLLTAEFDRVRTSGGDVRFRPVSAKLNISPATLNSWRQGRTFPSEKLEELAALLYPEGGAAQKTFKERLLNAKRTSDPIAISNLHNQELAVSYLEYAPFCRHPGQQPAGFCDAVFSRFLRLGRFRTVSHLRTGAEDAVEATRTSMSQISLCLFDSIPRSADLIAFHSPCRISINGICLERSQEKLDAIRKALTLGSGGAPAPSIAEVLTPFAVYNEIGFCYLRDSIGLTGSGLIQTVDSLTPECFAETLLNADPSKPTAVIIADEVTVLKTIAVLAKKGYADRTSLIFPLTTQRAAERHKRQLPGHLVSLTTVGTKQIQLADYLQKSLSLLLQTESELISDLYLHLYYGLRDLVKECIGCLDTDGVARLQTLQDEPAQNPALWASACADRVARYALRLNQGDVVAAVAASHLPWFHIIEVVRQRIGPPQEGTEHPDLGRIRIACRPYPLFCEVPEPNQDKRAIENYGFLGQLLKPLRQFINTDQIDVIRDARRIRAIGEPGWPDVRIGLFATLDRSLHWKHLDLPCSLPLNAVVRMTDRGDWNALRTKISNSLSANPAKSQPWRAGVRPVVLYLGSGFEYVVNTLGYDPPPARTGVVTVQELNCALYAQQLVESPPGETRVAVVDILTCLQILNEPNLMADGRLVFPLQATEGFRLPSYRIGIAVNKDSKEWIDFFEDAYPRLLETNVDWIAHCYALLFGDLVKFLRLHRDRLIQQNVPSAEDFSEAHDDVISRWTKMCLGFDRMEILPDEQRLWKPILTAANELISKQDA